MKTDNKTTAARRGIKPRPCDFCGADMIAVPYTGDEGFGPDSGFGVRHAEFDPSAGTSCWFGDLLDDESSENWLDVVTWNHRAEPGAFNPAPDIDDTP